MKRFVFAIVFLLFAGGFSLAQAKEPDDVALFIEMMQSCHDNDVETGEYRNELLFEIIDSPKLPELLEKVEEDTLLQSKILLELENPLSDTFDLNACITKLKAVKGGEVLRQKMINALRKSRQKVSVEFVGDEEAPL